MTKRDERLLEEMKQLGLNQSQMAELVGVSRQALHTGIRNKNDDYFSLDRLTAMVRRSKNPDLIKDDGYLHTDYKKELKKILLREFSEKLAISCRDLPRYIDSALSFCQQGIGAWWWVEAPATTETLADLLRPHGTFSELTIGVDAAMTAAAMATLETWAYGRYGNFADRLQVHLVELAEPPFATMIGAFQDRELRGFIDCGEGFAPLEHPAFAEFPELHEHLAALANRDLAPGDTLRWSLPVTPEARIIELLLRDNEEREASLPAAALDYLQEWQAHFEAGGVEPDSGSAWHQVFQALPAAVLQDRFGRAASEQIRCALEAAKLLRI